MKVSILTDNYPGNNTGAEQSKCIEKLLNMILMESVVPLNTLTGGERGEIVSFEGGSFFRKKLEEMGLRIGTTITIVARQWMRGPVIVRFENTEVAIGFNMAKRIMVKKI